MMVCPWKGMQMTPGLYRVELGVSHQSAIWHCCDGHILERLWLTVTDCSPLQRTQMPLRRHVWLHTVRNVVRWDHSDTTTAAAAQKQLLLFVYIQSITCNMIHKSISIPIWFLENKWPTIKTFMLINTFMMNWIYWCVEVMFMLKNFSSQTIQFSKIWYVGMSTFNTFKWLRPRSGHLIIRTL